VLAGRVLADAVRTLFVIGLMIVMGFLVDFRSHTGFIAFVATVGLLLLFGMALSWIMAFVGLVTGYVGAAILGTSLIVLTRYLSS